MSTEISPDILRSLGRIEGNQEQMNERLREMNGRFDRVDARFDRTDTRFDRADARFDRLLLAFAGRGGHYRCGPDCDPRKAVFGRLAET